MRNLYHDYDLFLVGHATDKAVIAAITALGDHLHAHWGGVEVYRTQGCVTFYRAHDRPLEAKVFGDGFVIGDVFGEWNKGALDSFLIEITADILRQKDPTTGKPFVDIVLDTAGQKGTGKWTSVNALDMGVPIVPDEYAEQWLRDADLVADDDAGIAAVTPKGRAWLNLLIATPLPVKIERWGDRKSVV